MDGSDSSEPATKRTSKSTTADKLSRTNTDTQATTSKAKDKQPLSWPMRGYNAANTSANLSITESVGQGVEWGWETVSDFQYEGTPLSAFSPVALNESLYMGTYDGRLLSIDRTDGNIKWKSNHPNPFLSSPLVTPESVYAIGTTGADPEQSTSTLKSFEPYNGSENWLMEFNDALFFPILADENIYIAGGEVLYSINPKNESVRWKITPELVSRRPAISRDIVVVTTKDSTVLALDINSGKKRWETKLDEKKLSEPAIRGESIYVSSTSLHSLELRTGEKTWTSSTIIPNSEILAKKHQISSPAIAHDSVYVGGIGSLHSFDRNTGEQRWKYDINEQVQPNISTDANRVYFSAGGDGGNLYSVLKNRRNPWRQPISGGYTAEPVLLNGALYQLSTGIDNAENQIDEFYS